MIGCQWPPYEPIRDELMPQIRRTIPFPLSRTWDYGSDQTRYLIMLGKPVSDDDAMTDRMRRDLLVKKLMYRIDIIRRHHQRQPLCDLCPRPPPFSLAEAIEWLNEDLETDWWERLTDR